MEYTTNYRLKKPGDNDNVLVSDLNENMDKVDQELKKRANLDPDTGKVPETELPDDLFLKLTGGTMKGVIQMANFLIKGLPDPEEDGDAARKAYVDALRTWVGQQKFGKMVSGSYTGTGTDSVTLRFPSPVKFLHVTTNYANATGGLETSYLTWVGQQTSVSINGEKRTYSVSDGGKTLTWTGKVNGNFVTVLNSSYVPYTYFALCE